jgi:hypothetical protein
VTQGRAARGTGAGRAARVADAVRVRFGPPVRLELGDGGGKLRIVKIQAKLKNVRAVGHGRKHGKGNGEGGSAFKAIRGNAPALAEAVKRALKGFCCVGLGANGDDLAGLVLGLKKENGVAAHNKISP